MPTLYDETAKCACGCESKIRNGQRYVSGHNMRGQARKICSFQGCGKTNHARGLCAGHLRQAKNGLPLTELIFRRPKGSEPILNFREVPCEVEGLVGPCHEWMGGRNKGGYGKICVNRRMRLAHRYVWELLNGPIPEGLVIDHKCRNRACCNVGHLRVVTNAVNAVENSNGACARNVAKTHCKFGHPFSEENTYFYPTTGHRGCRACRKRIMEEHYAALRNK